MLTLTPAMSDAGGPLAAMLIRQSSRLLAAPRLLAGHAMSWVRSYFGQGHLDLRLRCWWRGAFERAALLPQCG